MRLDPKGRERRRPQRSAMSAVASISLGISGDAVRRGHRRDAGNLRDAACAPARLCDGSLTRTAIRDAMRSILPAGNTSERRFDVVTEAALELGTIAAFEADLVVVDEADALDTPASPVATCSCP